MFYELFSLEISTFQQMKKLIYLTLLGLILFSCKDEKEMAKGPIVVSPEQLHASVDKVTEIMIHDIFSPPVASRVFAYPNIAAYEIMAQANPDYLSLSGQLTDLRAIPKADSVKRVNYRLAALIAHMNLSKTLIFSEAKFEVLEDSLYTVWTNQNPEEFETAKAYGMQVADYIKEWMAKDNYAQTRTMPKFTVDTDDPSRWQPTPPAYIEGIEPHWNKIRPFAIDSAAQFKPSAAARFFYGKKFGVL